MKWVKSCFCVWSCTSNISCMTVIHKVCTLSFKLNSALSFPRMQPMKLEKWEAPTEENSDTVCANEYIFCLYSVYDDHFFPSRILLIEVCIYVLSMWFLSSQEPWQKKLWEQSSQKISLSLSGSLLRCLNQTVRALTWPVGSGNVFIVWQDVSDRNLRDCVWMPFFSCFLCFHHFLLSQDPHPWLQHVEAALL